MSWNELRPAASISGTRTCWRCWTSWTYASAAELDRVNRVASEHARAHHVEDAREMEGQ